MTSMLTKQALDFLEASGFDVDRESGSYIVYQDRLVIPKTVKIEIEVKLEGLRSEIVDLTQHDICVVVPQYVYFSEVYIPSLGQMLSIPLNDIVLSEKSTESKDG